MMARPEGAAPSVLFVLPDFHTNVHVATRALVEAGMRVSVFTPHPGRPETHDFVVPQVFAGVPDRQELAQALDRARPDLMLVRNSGDLSRPIYGMARRRGIRVIGYDQKPLTQLRSVKDHLRLMLLGRPRWRVTPVRGLDRAAPQDRCAIYLPWPVRADPSALPRPPKTAALRVLCVAKLAQPRKNQPRLIEALRAAGQAGRVHLTLVGSRTLKASHADPAQLAWLEREAASHDWITLLSDVPFRRMPQIYAAHDVCVLPSVQEPLGTSPLEAMAYGTVPVISTDAGSAGVLTEGQDGLRVDMSDPGDLPAVMQRLLDDRALVRRLSAGARATAGTDLSPEIFVARMRGLLASRGRGILR